MLKFKHKQQWFYYIVINKSEMGEKCNLINLKIPNDHCLQ